MSLFGDPNFQYRETYFVLLKSDDCPSSEKLIEAIESLGNNFQIVDSKINEGKLESITVDMSEDFAALDVTYVEGDEVLTQVEEIGEELRNMTLQGDELTKLSKIRHCNARFDVFHFERSINTEADEFIDPGGLLLVLERIASLCDGVSFDPQSQSIL